MIIDKQMGKLLPKQRSWRYLGAVCFLTVMTSVSQAAGADLLPTALTSAALISPTVQTGLFTAITRTDHRLIAVGERGRILLSDDNGATWRQVETPTSVTLTGVDFLTTQDGWAIGQMGVVLATKDSGLTWTRQLDGVKANQLLMAAAQADSAAQNNNAVAAANLQAAQQLVQGGPSTPFLGVLALPPRNLLISGGYGMAFSSTDGGTTWKSIFDAIPNPNGSNIYEVLKGQKSLYFIGEQGFIVRRNVDGSYTTLQPPSQGTFFGGLVTPSNALLVFGLQGTILRSADDGAHWAQSPSGVSVGIDSGIKLQDNEILLGDIAGDLLLSHDDGATFRVIPTGQPVTGIAQAVDGMVVITGPFGLKRLSLPQLQSGG